MTDRRSERLAIVDTYYPSHDAVIQARNPEAEAAGLSDCDLRCGENNELLLRNFTVENAQDHFRLENMRVIIKCPTCGSYNLLAAAVEEQTDGSIVTFPGTE